MLEHLTHVEVSNSAEAIEHLKTSEPFKWIVFVIPPEKTEKGTKNAMYKRMWKLRAEGFDAMVRRENEEFVLVAMTFKEGG